MCPFCIATAATYAVSASSGGGIVAVVVAKLRRKSRNRKIVADSVNKEKEK
jgi:hypothetical protein